MFEELKRMTRKRSILTAGLLILVALLSLGSGIYAGASFFAPLASVTVTTTTFTTNFITSTVLSTITETVSGVLTTIQYTSSTSTVTVTGGTTTYKFGDTNIETARTFSRGYVYSNSFTTSIPVTVMQISYYSGISQSVRVGIYSDASGSPSIKLAETSLDSCTAAAWHTFTISYPLAPGSYWLAFTMSGNNVGGDVYAKAAGTGKYMAHTYDGTLPATFAVTGTHTYTYSLYATATG